MKISMTFPLYFMLPGTVAVYGIFWHWAKGPLSTHYREHEHGVQRYLPGTV
jgi:hypothetical protein